MKFLLNVFFILADVVNTTFALIRNGFGFRTLTYAVSKRGWKRKLDLYLPKKADEPSPVILYIHGGGWMAGSKKGVQPSLLAQIKRGYAVASVSYSFAPLSKYPAQIHEVKAAVRWLRLHAEEYGLDTDKIVVWGISAGAHLGNLLGCSSGSDELNGEMGYPEYSSDVQGVISWYGPTDLNQMGNNGFFDKLTNIASLWLIGGNLTKNMEKAQLANPIKYINSQTPPFLLFHGTYDRVININQSELLFEALQENGTDVKYLAVDKFYHSDTRFNRPVYTQEIENFLDKIRYS